MAALREAYEKTIRDPEFLAEVKAKHIVFAPMSGPDLSYVDKCMAMSPARIGAARKIYAELLALP